MCGGFVGNVLSGIGINPSGGNTKSFLNRAVKGTANVVKHPVTSTKKALHNPADLMLGNNIRQSSLYKNVVRPAVKFGTDLGVGYLAGDPAGLLAAGLSGTLAGDLGNKPFNPVQNLALPAVAGYTAGHTGAGDAFNQFYNSGRAQGMSMLDAGVNAAQGALDAAFAPEVAGSVGSTLLNTGANLLSGGFGGTSQPAYIQPTPQNLPSTGAPIAAIQQPLAGGGSNPFTQQQDQQGGMDKFGNVHGVAPI